MENKEITKEELFSKSSKLTKTKFEVKRIMPLSAFSREEMNYIKFLFALISEEGNAKIKIKFKDIREVLKKSGIDNENELSTKNIYQKLKEMNKKISRNNFVEMESKTEHLIFAIFLKFKTDSENQVLEIKLNDEFLEFFNDFKLSMGFDTFRLGDFLRLKSKYSKLAYDYFWNFRETKKVRLSIDELKRVLKISPGYNSSRIKTRILKNINLELQEIFIGFSIWESTRGKSKEILGFEFSWRGIVKNPIREVIQNRNQIKLFGDTQKLTINQKEPTENQKYFFTKQANKLLDNGEIEVNENGELEKV